MHTQNNYTRKVVVPSSVNIKLEQGTLSVEGPLGTLQIDISLYDPSNLMNIQIKENPVSQIVVQSYYQYAKPIMQTFSTIIESSMIGVTQGHMMQLEAVGVGYKISCTSTHVQFKVGLSHTVSCIIPNDVRMFTPKPSQLVIFGIDKQRVSQVLAQLRSIRITEPYKGKGLRRKTDIILRKEGKKK